MAYDFDEIARDYDRMNRLMTLGMDCRWRKRAVRELSTSHSPLSTLDVACGTGDMTVELLKRGCTVTGVDLSEEMLAIARQKTASAHFPLSTFHFQLGNAEQLPFGDESFDAVTCAFGIRNFVHLEQGLGEMVRVLKPGGRMAILELSTPDNPFVRFFYNIYTRHIIPWLGSRIAGNREAYTYLPSSIERFPKGTAMVDKLKAAGGREVKQQKLTLGVCRLYILVK